MTTKREIAEHFLKSLRDVAGGVVKGEGLAATPEERDRRRKICDGCSIRDVDDDTCGACGCPINNLTFFKLAKCKLDRWNQKENDKG